MMKYVGHVQLYFVSFMNFCIMSLSEKNKIRFQRLQIKTGLLETIETLQKYCMEQNSILFHFISPLLGYFTTCQSLDYITSYSTMTEELERIWKEAVMVHRVIILANIVTRKWAQLLRLQHPVLYIILGISLLIWKCCCSCTKWNHKFNCAAS
jgi:hypothetical protein